MLTQFRNQYMLQIQVDLNHSVALIQFLSKFKAKFLIDIRIAVAFILVPLCLWEHSYTNVPK